MPLAEPNSSPEQSQQKPAKEIVIPLNVILPAVALIMALTALGLNYFHDPLGAGLNAYDFSTTKSAIESEAKIQINHDFRAMMQKEELLDGPRQKERLKTLEVRREAEWRGKVLLFVTFSENGIRKYQILGVEKHARSGIWFPTYAGQHSTDMKEQNPLLAQQIADWENMDCHEVMR